MRFILNRIVGLQDFLNKTTYDYSRNKEKRMNHVFSFIFYLIMLHRKGTERLTSS